MIHHSSFFGSARLNTLYRTNSVPAVDDRIQPWEVGTRSPRFQ
jgi:hypothetical protein